MVVVATFGLVLLHIVSDPYPVYHTFTDRVLDGFGGADKVFLIEFSMPMDGTVGFK
jgi:hypothetical protein